MSWPFVAVMRRRMLYYSSCCNWTSLQQRSCPVGASGCCWCYHLSTMENLVVAFYYGFSFSFHSWQKEHPFLLHRQIRWRMKWQPSLEPNPNPSSGALDRIDIRTLYRLGRIPSSSRDFGAFAFPTKISLFQSSGERREQLTPNLQSTPCA